MPRIDFAQLPSDARVWIFSSDRVLSNDQQTQLLANVDGFLAQWGAHDTPLTAGREIRYDRFLFIAVDQKRVGPSGCSVDALVRQMKTVQQELGVELVDNAPVLFRRGDETARVARDGVLGLVAEGGVSFGPSVFDNTLACLGDVRNGRWETRAERTWHGRAFF